VKVITPPRLWSFFMHVGPSQDWGGYQEECQNEGPDAAPTYLERDQFEYLKVEAAVGNIKAIMVDQYASENHPGGDDLVSLADEVLTATRDGLQVITWYGPQAEVCVVAFKHGLAVGWLTPTEIEAMAAGSHYVKELIAHKRMWGPNATIGVIRDDGTGSDDLPSVGALLRRGLCTQEFLGLDRDWPYMLTIKQERQTPVLPADKYPDPVSTGPDEDY